MPSFSGEALYKNAPPLAGAFPWNATVEVFYGNAGVFGNNSLFKGGVFMWKFFNFLMRIKVFFLSIIINNF